MTQASPHDGLRGADRAFQERARELIAGLFVLVRVALLHRMDNQATEPAVRRLLAALDAFHADVADAAALQFVGDAVYVNRRLVHTDIKAWQHAQFLAGFFAKMQLAEIELSVGVDEASIRAFIQAVRDATLDERAGPALHTLELAGIRFRDLDARGVAGDPALEVPDRFRVLRAYGLLYVTLRDLLDRVASGQRPRIVPVRRAAQELAGLPERTRGMQLALLELGVHRRELAGRLAFVGMLAGRMARRAGLDPAQARDIIVAASLAGVGRVLDIRHAHAPPDALARSNAFAGGARALLAVSGRGRHAALRMIVAAEQQSAETRRAGHPVSRLTATAAAYERLTHAPPIGAGLSSGDALARLATRADLDLDTVDLLAGTLGRFAPGSLVRLETGETAVVRDAPARVGAMPPVFVVADAAGETVPLRAIDLAEAGIRVVASVDGRSAGLNPTHYLFCAE
ncbi:MAG: hypothetical protein H6719_38805 [Sandaracinaceae bacterium]|nr:hypothetical protein [Sandaracinaceae bacterium]